MLLSIKNSYSEIRSIIHITFVFFFALFSLPALGKHATTLDLSPDKAISFILYYYLESEYEKSKDIAEQVIEKYDGDDAILAKMMLLASHYGSQAYAEATKLHHAINQFVSPICEHPTVLKSWENETVEFYCYLYYTSIGLSYFKLKNYDSTIETFVSKLPVLEKYASFQVLIYQALFSSYLNTQQYSSAEKYLLLLKTHEDVASGKFSVEKVYYNYACLESLRGNQQRASRWLHKVTSNDILTNVNNDDDLVGFRKSHYFQEIKTRLENHE